MSFGSIVFTNKGRTLQAKAQAGSALVFTRMAMGDGNLTGQSIRDLNNLISHKKDIPITRINHHLDGTAKIGGELNNQDMIQGFYWREIGLFATDPDVGEILYCYGNAAELAEYIPPGDVSQIIERIVEIVAIIGDASNVSAVINSSLIYLTLEDLEAHNTSNTSHQDIRQNIEDQGQQISGLSAPATDTKLGLVKVGNNLSITSDGLLSGAAPYAHPVAKQCNYVAPVSSVAGKTGVVTLAKADVALGSVLNYGIATTEEAQAGTSNVKYMTPALVKAAVQYMSQNGGFSVVKNVQSGTVTAAQSNVNVTIAPVNMSKSFVILPSIKGMADNTYRAISLAAYLTSATNLLLNTSGTQHRDVGLVAWQVVEFY